MFYIYINMTEQTHKKCICEYVWIDACGDMRSKVKVNYVKIDNNKPELLVGEWSFDGSSTQQAPGGSSDCQLKPVYICSDPERSLLGTPAYLVMCEVLDSQGNPHESNGRATIEDDDNDYQITFI